MMVSRAAALCSCVAALSWPMSAGAATSIDGVSYTSRQLELVKKVSARRSVIYPEHVPDATEVAQEEGAIHTGLADIGRQLDGLLLTLRRADSPYPLLHHALLDYAWLKPIEQSPARGRMYIMYVGELHWPFPAPLLADMLRLRVTYDFPQPLRDLLTTVLFRWGRDQIDRAEKLTPAARRSKVEGLLDELQDGGVIKSGWRHDRTARELLSVPLEASEIRQLQRLSESGPLPVRTASLKVLGVGGHLSEPGWYARLLADPEPAVRYAAFWALVFMPGKAALPHLQRYSERSHAIAARLREALPAISTELVTRETASFDHSLSTLTGAPCAEPLPGDFGPAPQPVEPAASPAPSAGSDPDNLETTSGSAD